MAKRYLVLRDYVWGGIDYKKGWVITLEPFKATAFIMNGMVKRTDKPLTKKKPKRNTNS